MASIPSFPGKCRFLVLLPVVALAVGAPLEDAAAFNSCDVTVFFGSVSGLQSSVMLIQVGDLPEQNEQFGRALAVGDFDGDIDCILRLKE